MRRTPCVGTFQLKRADRLLLDGADCPEPRRGHSGVPCPAPFPRGAPCAPPVRRVSVLLGQAPSTDCPSVLSWRVAPSRLRQVLRACLQKEPKDRVRDIGDVSVAMKGTFETVVTAPSEPTIRPRLHVWQQPIPAVAAGLTLLVIGGVAVWSLTLPAPPRVARFPIPLAADQNFSFTGRPTVGRSLPTALTSFTWRRAACGCAPSISVAIQVPGTEEEARGPFFSADGQSIGFWADGQLKKVSVSGGGHR